MNLVIISLIGNETFCEICKRKKHLHKSKKEGEAAPVDPENATATTEEKPERHHRRHIGTLNAINRG
jgi:hypothetical protein